LNWNRFLSELSRLLMRGTKRIVAEFDAIEYDQ
jgi:hypothetical protein